MAEDTATKTSSTVASETAEEEVKEVDPNLLTTLACGTTVKYRIPRQRACNNPRKNNNICRGHLKRWYDFEEDVAQYVKGMSSEVYRCERCQTLYLPNIEETARTGTLAF